MKVTQLSLPEEIYAPLQGLGPLLLKPTVFMTDPNMERHGPIGPAEIVRGTTGGWL